MSRSFAVFEPGGGLDTPAASHSTVDVTRAYVEGMSVREMEVLRFVARFHQP